MLKWTTDNGWQPDESDVGIQRLGNVQVSFLPDICRGDVDGDVLSFSVNGMGDSDMTV